jgi:hypothetical protein
MMRVYSEAQGIVIEPITFELWAAQAGELARFAVESDGRPDATWRSVKTTAFPSSRSAN